MLSQSASSKSEEFFGNLSLSVGALIVILLFLEFVVFRFVLVPDDELRNVAINKVVRYQPNSTAVFRHPDGTQSTVRTNAQGWNSHRPFFEVERVPGVIRVAVIGDSYVHAKFVEQDEGFPAVIERGLRARGQKAEVYRFGMDGAPLSQYLHMLRREVTRYKPDVVVVPLVHDDFDESYRFIKRRFASNFLKLRRDDKGGVAEVSPVRFANGVADKLRASAMFRYVYYETGLHPHAMRWVGKLFMSGNDDWRSEIAVSGVPIGKIMDHDSNRFFTRYVLSKMKVLSKQHGFKLIFAMDGVRQAIYSKHPLETYDIWKLNLMVRDLTRELGLPLVELHDVFRADFSKTRLRLEFPYDWHWNQRANVLVGEAITNAIALELRLPARLEQTALIKRAALKEPVSNLRSFFR